MNLFIIGAARSGTTALTHLFNASRLAVVGYELYQRLFHDDWNLFQPNLFAKNSFLAALAEKQKLDDDACLELETRINGALALGDKGTIYDTRIEQLLNRFPHSRIAYIYRHPADVAQSYAARKANPDDPWRWGAEIGLKDWRKSVVNALAVAGDSRVKFVDYGYLFDCMAFPEFQSRVTSLLEAVFEKRISLAPDVVSRFEKIHTRALEARKGGVLGSAWCEFQDRGDLENNLAELQLVTGR